MNSLGNTKLTRNLSENARRYVPVLRASYGQETCVSYCSVPVCHRRQLPDGCKLSANEKKFQQLQRCIFCLSRFINQQCLLQLIWKLCCHHSMLGLQHHLVPRVPSAGNARQHNSRISFWSIWLQNPSCCLSHRSRDVQPKPANNKDIYWRKRAIPPCSWETIFASLLFCFKLCQSFQRNELFSFEINEVSHKRKMRVESPEKQVRQVAWPVPGFHDEQHGRWSSRKSPLLLLPTPCAQPTKDPESWLVQIQDTSSWREESRFCSFAESGHELHVSSALHLHKVFFYLVISLVPKFHVIPPIFHFHPFPLLWF